MKETIAKTRLERQLELEQEMIFSSITRYRDTLMKASEKSLEATTKTGLRLLKETIEPFSQAIQTYLQKQAKVGRPQAAVKYLQMLDPDVVAFIAAKSVLNSITKRLKLQHAATNIANLLEDEARLMHFASQNKAFYQSVYNRIRMKTSYEYKRTVLVHSMNKDGIEWEPWPLVDKLHLGVKCLDLLMESTQLVEKIMVPESKNKTPYYLVATQKTLNWLDKENEHNELLSPVYYPMLVPPKDWTSPTDGGYYSEMPQKIKLVKTYSPTYLEEIKHIPMPLVYEAVNRMQQTAWRVNTDVLEVLREIWAYETDIANLPPRSDQTPQPCPLPSYLKPKEMDESQQEVFKDWKRQAAYVYEQNIINRSKRLLVSKILYLADKFKDEPEIFFPYMLDFRGRAYTIPNFLNPQGTDLAKALLTFAHGKPIETEQAARWLAIHGANVYGYDKVSLDERVQFIEAMNEDICRIAEDPLTNLQWTEADKPWQFLAFCFEWAGYLREGYGFVSCLPVALDGSCNGLQHFSAMLRDHIGGEAVNLIPSDQPQDIYQRVADVVLDKLKQAIVSHDPESELAHKWLQFGITRHITKRPVMILPYGGTRYACREYIEEYVRERMSKGQENVFALPDRDRIFEASEYLAGIVWDSIGEVVVAAREVMDWLRKVASLGAKEGLPVNWITPSGFPVQQVYHEMKSRQIDTQLSGRIIKLSLREYTSNIDFRRQANGISPNFVHSMDAAALHLYICEAAKRGLENFSLVHDSYGTLAADTEVSAQCIREVFVAMYQDDVLEKFRAQLLDLLSEKHAAKVPLIPPKGQLDLEAIKQSAFFFA